MKKLVTFILVAALICAATIPASAANPAVTLQINKYNSNTGTYETANSAISGDVLMLSVGINGTVPSLSALKIKLYYNGNTTKYIDGTVTTPLTGGSPLFNNKFNSENPGESYIIAYWSVQGSEDYFAQNISGNVVSFLFDCSKIGGADFSVEISEIFDGSFKSVVMSSKVAKVPFNIENYQLSSELITVFEKIVNLSYSASGNSQADIEAADVAYTALTAAQQQAFKICYPDLFTSYQTAWTRYYDLIASISSPEAAQSEVQSFVNSANYIELGFNALTPENVTVENYQKVLQLKKSYNNLSTKAKAILGSAEIERLTKLFQAAATVEDDQYNMNLANSMVTDFISEVSPYNYLLNIEEDLLLSDSAYYENMALVIEAQTTAQEIEEEYGSLISSENRKKFDAAIAKINRLYKVIEEKAAQDKDEAALVAEISEFTGKYSAVLRLNASTVGVKSISGLELAIAAISELSDNAQSRLAAKKQVLTQLLDLANGLITLETDTGTAVPVGSTVTVKETVTEKQVEVPVEKIVTDVQTKMQTQVRKTPTVVLVMALLACVSMLSMFIPISLQLINKRKKANIADEGEFDNE